MNVVHNDRERREETEARDLGEWREGSGEEADDGRRGRGKHGPCRAFVRPRESLVLVVELRPDGRFLFSQREHKKEVCV